MLVSAQEQRLGNAITWLIIIPAAGYFLLHLIGQRLDSKDSKTGVELNKWLDRRENDRRQGKR